MNSARTGIKAEAVEHCGKKQQKRDEIKIMYCDEVPSINKINENIIQLGRLFRQFVPFFCRERECSFGNDLNVCCNVTACC